LSLSKHEASYFPGIDIGSTYSPHANSIGQLAAFLLYFPGFITLSFASEFFNESFVFETLVFMGSCALCFFPLRTSHTRHLATGDLRDKGFSERAIIYRRASRSDLKVNPVTSPAAASKLSSGTLNHHDCRCQPKKCHFGCVVPEQAQLRIVEGYNHEQCSRTFDWNPCAMLCLQSSSTIFLLSFRFFLLPLLLCASFCVSVHGGDSAVASLLTEPYTNLTSLVSQPSQLLVGIGECLDFEAFVDCIRRDNTLGF
jgi:hypothetical protein